MLSRALAHKSHYPAIDVLQSVSRLATEVTTPPVREAAAALRETLAAYRAKEDLITIGAYSPGADAGVDYAIAKVPQIDAFLRQPADEAADAARDRPAPHRPHGRPRERPGYCRYLQQTVLHLRPVTPIT